MTGLFGTPTRLSVIVPCHNESATISKTVEEIKAAWGLRSGLEILLVDDASTDDSLKIMKSLSTDQDSCIRAVHRASQGGLGGALMTGFEEASGDVLTWLPGDGEYQMADVLKAFDLLPECDMVLVRRGARGQLSRGLVSLAMHFLIRVFFFVDLRGFCGIFVIRRSDWLRLRIQGSSSFFTLEAAIVATTRAFKFRWIRAKWTPRSHGTSSVFRPRVVVRSLGDLLALRLRMNRK